MSQLNCFATRLVNPFVGILQAIEYESARAISRDGYNWEIQIGVQRSRAGWGSLNRHQQTFNYYRYASWNPADGMRRMPLDPSLEREPLETSCQLMLSQLQSGLLKRLPFPLRDHYELWLLDHQQMPLALLASTLQHELIPKLGEQRWRAVSAALPLEGYSSRQAQPLEDLIRSHASGRQWFHRQSAGEAVGLDYLASPGQAGRVLPATEFPELLVRERWDETSANQLLTEWIHSMAPWLLQLPAITPHRRRQLEQDAFNNPEMVDVNHRLYPQIIDQQLLISTRVAAKLKAAKE